MDLLTACQEKFVLELVAGKSQREAYRAAYISNKSSDKTIDSRACRLLAVDKVLARYNELISKVRKEAEDSTIYNVLEIMRDLKTIGKAKLTDFLEYKTAPVLVRNADETDEAVDIIDYRTIIDFKDSSEVDATAIQEISISKDGTVKIKLHDKIKAMELAGKQLGMFKTEIKLSGEVGLTVAEYLDKCKGDEF